MKKSITNKALALILAPALTFGGVAGFVVLGAAPAYAASSAEQVANIILADTNEFRAANGLAPLKLTPSISAVAQAWTQHQADTYTMDHNPNYGSQMPAGWSLAGENVAAGYAPQDVVNAWIASPGHRANLLGNYTDLGVGYAVDGDGSAYFTQNFGNYASTKTVASAPAVPTLTAGVGSITASWAAPTNTGNQPITGYTVRAIPAGGGTAITVNSASTSATVTGLANGVQYYIDVVANNASGSSVWSGAAAINTLAGPPAAPAISVNEPTSNGVIVNWSGANGGSAITSWTVTLNGQADRVVTSPSTEFTGLNPATVYNGTVTATNAVGTSTVSAFSFTTAIAPPSEVRNLTLAQAGTSTTVNATWLAPAANGGGTVIGYDVALINVSTGVTVETKTVTATNAAFTVVKGSAYKVTVSAKNTAGASPVLTSQNLNVVVNVAGAPTAVTSELVDEQVIDLTWKTPTDDGGAAITGYLISAYENGSTTAAFNQSVGVANTATLNANGGIKAGVDYTFKVAAINSAGLSANSSASPVVEVPRTPTAPDAVSGVKFTNVTSTGATANWTAPEYNGGSAITGYKVTFVDSEGNTIKTSNVNDTVSTVAITGLTRGSVYNVNVVAINDRGTSNVTSEKFTTLLEKPSAPTNAVLKSDDAGVVTATWTAPTDNGGKAIDSYRVQLVSNNVVIAEKNVRETTVSFDGAASTVYTVNVFANNTQIESNSVASNSVSTPTPPSDAQNVALATTGSRTATVTWDAPATEGTKPLASYKVDIFDAAGNLAATKTVDAAVTTADFTGLNRATEYHATVQTFSTITSGNVATSASAVTLAEAPDAVTDLKLVIVNSTGIKATWAAPVNDGGSAITGYEIKLTTDGMTDTTTYNGLELSYSDLDPAVDYTISVKAINAVGSSTVVTEDITTSAVVPSAPRTVKAVVDGTSVSATWLAPTSNGGATVTGYTATLKDASTNATVATKNVTSAAVSFDDVNRNKDYYITVTAKNTVGNSVGVNSSNVNVPAIVPTAVVGLNLSLSGATAVVVSWDAPKSNGGAVLNDYSVAIYDGDVLVEARDVAATSTTFENLNPVTSYTVEVTAVNIAGTGPVSTKSITTKAISASAPQNVVATSADNTVSATWDAPKNNGGAAITGYTATLVNVATNEAVTRLTVTETNITFLDVPRGQDYKVTVVANNSAGVSVVTNSNNTLVSAIAPDAPAGVKATADGSAGVNVEWSAPKYNGGAAITGYNVVLLDGDRIIASKVLDANAFSANFIGLNPVTKYTVTVSATNNAGVSTVATATATTKAAAPAAPIDAKTTVEGTTVSSTWLPPLNNGGAEVTGYTATLVNANNETVATKNVTSTEATFENIARGAVYKVNVTAMNVAGTSPAVTSNEVTVEAIISDAPATATAETAGEQEVKVTWTAPKYNGGAAITSYKVIIQSALGEAATLEVAGNVYSATVVLTADTEYTFSVTAINAKGESAATNVEGTFLTAPAVAPEAPTEEATAAAETTEVVRTDVNTLTVTLKGRVAGVWVYGYVSPTSTGLGWAQVDANGVAKFTLENADLVAGDYTLSVLDKDGAVLNAGEFTIEAAPVVIPPVVTTPPVVVAPVVTAPGAAAPVVVTAEAVKAAAEVVKAAEAKKAEEAKKAAELARTGVANVEANAGGALAALLLGMGLLVGNNIFKRRKSVTKAAKATD